MDLIPFHNLQLVWKSPWWGLLILIPAISLLIRKRQTIPDKYRQFIDEHLLPYMLVHTGHARRISLIALLGWITAITALARPVIETDHGIASATTVSVVAVFDISNSMLTNDVPPNRLERAKLELRRFIQASPESHIAVIAYATNAYLVSPFTQHHDSLMEFVHALQPDLTTHQGSHMIRALELARQTAGEKGNIILFTDGGAASPDLDIIHAARRIKTDQIHLVTVGLGTKTGGFVTNSQGQVVLNQGKPVVSRIAESRLQRLNDSAGGNLLILPRVQPDWQTELKAMHRDEPPRLSPASDMELFPYLIGMSLLCFFWLGSKRYALLPVMCIGICCSLPAPTQAGLLSDYYDLRGQQALKNKQYTLALEYFSHSTSFFGLMGKGVAHYRQQQWEQARQAFQEALKHARNDKETIESTFNLANTNAQAGEYEQAIREYRQILELDPHYKPATINLNRVLQLTQTLKLNRKPQFSESGEFDPDAGKRQQRDRPSMTIILPASSETDPIRSYAETLDDHRQLLQSRFQQIDRRYASQETQPW
ncbi:MAG: VWA domain-containing protein [Gammaproteobacteria bacterium]|nr:MAG: VWA domain-containing protein [Gammaproteobacteria bacterium]